MSFENPTALRVGMSGTLSSKSYRVAGRVVMGVDIDGETYYWNEFNLVNTAGESATLVYEETENGGDWKLFVMFEPEYPMTAEDAATKQVGDPLNLEGTSVSVTLVDQSRVYHIEGQAPEGVEVGDVAHYFNAESGKTMQVVSWTGDEVEYFRGITLPRGLVSGAFGIRETTSRNLSQYGSLLSPSSGTSSYSGASMGGLVFKVAVAIVFLVLFIIIFRPSWIPVGEQPAVVRSLAPSSPLKVGSTGKLEGTSYRITRHELVEISEVGIAFQRHEYQLVDGSENKVLLVFGLQPRGKDWALFSPTEPASTMTPQEAGSVRFGDKVNINGVVVPVSEIFSSAVKQVDIEGESPYTLKLYDILFGFEGHSGSTIWLVKWDKNRIVFQRGKSLAEKEVIRAFTQPAQN